MENNNRKPNRLKEYNYSANGAYFITICVKNMKCVLSKITVGEGLCALPRVELSKIGYEVEKAINYIDNTYRFTKVKSFVIMPNHIHLLIEIEKPQGIMTGGHGDPPLQSVIGAFKSYTNSKYNGLLWQRSYYDHIVRNEEDMYYHLQYIEENPKKWLIGKDKYYI